MKTKNLSNFYKLTNEGNQAKFTIDFRFNKYIYAYFFPALMVIVGIFVMFGKLDKFFSPIVNIILGTLELCIGLIYFLLYFSLKTEIIYAGNMWVFKKNGSFFTRNEQYLTKNKNPVLVGVKKKYVFTSSQINIGEQCYDVIFEYEENNIKYEPNIFPWAFRFIRPHRMFSKEEIKKISGYLSLKCRFID